jgi:ATP-dependent RNA helicase DeaD
LLALIHKVNVVEVNEQDIAPFMPVIEKEFADMSKQEILKRFASIEFNRFLDYYKNAKDLNAREDRNHERKFVREESLSRNGDRIFINLGKMDEVMVPQLLELIDRTAGIKGKEIGNIKLKGAYSFFEIDPKLTPKVLNSFKGIEYKGRQVRVEVKNEDDDSYSDRGKPVENYSGRRDNHGDKKERFSSSHNPEKASITKERYGSSREKFGEKRKRERFIRKK